MNKYIIFKTNFSDIGKKEEWTSYYDIGKCYNGERLTLEQYEIIEEKYLKMIEDFLKNLKINFLKIKYIENNNNLKWRKKQQLNINEIIEISKDCLREKCWVILSAKKFKIKFGYDYYIFIETKHSFLEIKNVVDNNGLFIKKYDEYVPNNTKAKENIVKNEYSGFAIFTDFYILKNNKTKYILTYYKEGMFDFENYYWILLSIKKGIFNKNYDEIILSNKQECSQIDLISEFNAQYNTNFSVLDLKKIKKSKILRIFYRTRKGLLTCLDIKFVIENDVYYFYYKKNTIFNCNNLELFITKIKDFINNYEGEINLKKILKNKMI